MTNILSILGETNGDGGRVYGNLEKLGGFRGKGGFRMRSAECEVRNLGGDLRGGRLPIERRDFGLMGPAAADPATAGHSRAPKEGSLRTAKEGGRRRPGGHVSTRSWSGKVGIGWELVGTVFRFCWGICKGWEKGEKIPSKFPAKVGTESAVLLGKWKGGGNFPLFPGYEALEVVARRKRRGNNHGWTQMDTDGGREGTMGEGSERGVGIRLRKAAVGMVTASRQGCRIGRKSALKCN